MLRTKVPTRGAGRSTVSEFTVAAGESVAFVMSDGLSHEDDPPPIEPRKVIRETTEYWRAWSRRCQGGTPWDDALSRSLLTLKALIYRPTGGIVAAPTTSLPEALGGRAQLGLPVLLAARLDLHAARPDGCGYLDEARAWRDWLMRAVAGSPEQAHILYGIAGERLLPEIEIDWLPGYEGSRPVRVGNAASQQFQLDVYGEIFDALYQAHERGMEGDEVGRRVGLALLDHLERSWREPDEGIWEVRGGRKPFVHSKVMAWVAFDRAIRLYDGAETDEIVLRWARVRDEIHREVCEKGFDPSSTASCSITARSGSTRACC